MENNSEVVYLYLDDIIPNRFQPRELFDEQALKELAVSIKEHGVIQPIIVRQVDNKYEIIAGERRYKASTMAGLTKIPAIVKNLDDKESSKVALIENLQRRDLTPIEEARTYQKILELEDEMTQEQLAATMGKTQSSVSNKLRLLALPEEVQDALLNEKISERHARSLLNIENENDQVKMLNRIIEEKLTVRELDKIIKEDKEGPSEPDTPSLVSVSPIGDKPAEEPVVEEKTETEESEEKEETVQEEAGPTPIVEETATEETNVATTGEPVGSAALEQTEPAPIEAAPVEQPVAPPTPVEAPADTGTSTDGGINIKALIRDISDNSPTGEVKAPDTGISNIDVSKIANPFAKPESTAPEDPKVENENISSSITTEQVSAPAPVAPVAPPAPAATPASGGTDANSALNSIRALVEPYKQSGVVKDFKEFEFGNYVTLTIRINKGA